MRPFKFGSGALRSWFVGTVEAAGLAFVAVGLHQIYDPEAFIFGGAVLVFVAQGMECHE